MCEETRRRVQAIIDQSGYKPNTYARNLKLGKHYHIAYAPLPAVESRYWDLVGSGILKAAQELESFTSWWRSISSIGKHGGFPRAVPIGDGHPSGSGNCSPSQFRIKKKLKTMEDLPPSV
jgi:hypothetical protein